MNNKIIYCKQNGAYWEVSFKFCQNHNFWICLIRCPKSDTSFNLKITFNEIIFLKPSILVLKHLLHINIYFLFFCRGFNYMKYSLANIYQNNYIKNFQKFIKYREHDRNISNTPKVGMAIRKSLQDCYNIKGIIFILLQ